MVEIGDLPLYNQDLDGNPPEQWLRFRDQVGAAHGVLFCSPEYNRGIPGVLKNAIDVGSRPYGQSVFDKKPAAIVTASPGSIGGFGANHQIRQACVFLNMPVMQQPEAYLGHVSDDSFDDKGCLKEGALKEIIVGLAFELLDHYLDAPAQGWPEKFIEFKKSRIAAGLEAYKAKAAKPAKVGPSLALKNYVGTFSDPWYGNIEIAQNKAGKLTFDFKSTPNMGGTLEHWQYDSFTTKFDDKTIEPAYVNFGLDADGKVERITMKPVSPLADFSYDYQDLLFTPVAK